MAAQITDISENGCYVALTHRHLQVQEIMDRVRSPEAGAIVLFAGELAASLSLYFLDTYLF